MIDSEFMLLRIKYSKKSVKVFVVLGKIVYLCVGRSWLGGVGFVRFYGNGRLRTFSSAFKLRNFETISEETATRRSRRVNYT